jgi:hypothetical protein
MSDLDEYDLNKAVEFAVELEDSRMIYLGEFDMTNWDTGWELVWKKATEVSEENDCDPDYMEVKQVDQWLQNAVSIFNICNKRNQKDGSDWFTFEVCMDQEDANEVQELLDKYSDSTFLKDLLYGYLTWGKL